jgi:hypothetical protein
VWFVPGSRYIRPPADSTIPRDRCVRGMLKAGYALGATYPHSPTTTLPVVEQRQGHRISVAFLCQLFGGTTPQ